MSGNKQPARMPTVSHGEDLEQMIKRGLRFIPLAPRETHTKRVSLELLDELAEAPFPLSHTAQLAVFAARVEARVRREIENEG